MIILFCLYLLSARGASVHANGENISSSCTTLDNCRTLWSIVWSSLTTIGLCTWGALHPNVPPPFPDEEEKPAGYWKSKECWISWMKKCGRCIRAFIRERVVLFIVALLVPEFILAWAIRQNLKAKEIVKEGFIKEGRHFPLTQEHGFFIVMGGFHLYKTRIIESGDDESGKKSQELGMPLRSLTAYQVLNFIRNGKVNLPNAKEIQDRGKSDWLGKTLVIFQTLWFVMQCIARGIERLPVTELEIIALAYTTINLGIYIAWWNKPRNINHPIRVIDRIVVEERGNAASEDKKGELPGLEAGRGNEDKGLIDGDGHSNKSRNPPRRQSYWKISSNLVESALLFIAGLQDKNVNLETLDGVPTFWAGGANEDIAISSDSLALLIGMAFGAVHCIAWSFPFPSHRALIMWRISAVTVVGAPILISTMLGFLFVVDGMEAPRWWSKQWQKSPRRVRDIVEKMGYVFLKAIFILFLIAPIFSAPLYVIARATTLVLAFTTLKELPAGAYQTVQWTNFIPHI